MVEIILDFIAWLSLMIGMIGIFIIVWGALKAFWLFIRHHEHEDFQLIRLELGSHVILGLDFLVGKDIIDTLLLDTGARFWEDLAGLGTVVAIRIILTHFMLKEIRDLEISNNKRKAALKRQKKKAEKQLKPL